MFVGAYDFKCNKFFSVSRYYLFINAESDDRSLLHEVIMKNNDKINNNFFISNTFG